MAFRVALACASLLALAACASGTRESAPTWALVRNPGGGGPAYVWQRADELPVSAQTIVGGQALAPLSAFAAYWPTPGPIASIHGFSGTVISRPERGQSGETLARDAEQCRQAAGMASRGAAAPGAVTAQSSGVLVDGEVVSFPGVAESSAIGSYSGCMNQRGYSVTEWSGRAG
jgi:hypothetical protein